MMHRIAVCLVSLVLSAPAWAQDPLWAQDQQSPPATGGSGAPTDMTKYGPWTRKPTDEAKIKKEVEAFFKEEESIMKKHDFEAELARIDFPIFMVTDDSKGVPKADLFDRQKYSDMMKPMFDQMPTDVQMTRKTTITVLSDSLATYTCDFTMTSGKEKHSGRNGGLVVKRDGQWKWKSMYEAGWGDYPSVGVGGSGVPETPEKQK